LLKLESKAEIEALQEEIALLRKKVAAEILGRNNGVGANKSEHLVLVKPDEKIPINFEMKAKFIE
jgi:hypothetical protein